MVDLVEKRGDVQIYDPVFALFGKAAGRLDRLPRAPARSEAVTGVAEGRIKDRCHRLQEQLLHESVENRRNAKGAFPARWLRDLYLSYRARLVRPFQKLRPNRRPMLPKVGS